MPEPFFTSVNGLDEDPRSNAREDDFDEYAWEEVGQFLLAAVGPRQILPRANCLRSRSSRRPMQ